VHQVGNLCIVCILSPVGRLSPHILQHYLIKGTIFEKNEGKYSNANNTIIQSVQCVYIFIYIQSINTTMYQIGAIFKI